jgi:hypothetical protein
MDDPKSPANPAVAGLSSLARRLFWWKAPEEALADRHRFLAQVMTFGTWRDIEEARRHWPAKAFRDALEHAPPGVFDARSWNYWHYVLDLLPATPEPGEGGPVPPLPARRLPEC